MFQICVLNLNLESFGIKFILLFLRIRTKLVLLDPTPTMPDSTDKWRSIKIIAGIAIGCVIAIVFSVLAILYLRRRCNKLEQEVKDEVVRPR